MKRLFLAASIAALSFGVHAGDSTTLPAQPPEGSQFVEEGVPCNGVGQIGTTSAGLLLSCRDNQWKRQFVIDEEVIANVRCESGNVYCSNDAPETIVRSFYDGVAAWRWTKALGPKSYCTLNTVAIGPRSKGTTAMSTGDYCRVFPSGTDTDTGLPLWYLRAGSRFGVETCGAVCMK
ncbi:hypothetical protein [Geopseudomonas aromaticivorans]